MGCVMTQPPSGSYERGEALFPISYDAGRACSYTRTALGPCPMPLARRGARMLINARGTGASPRAVLSTWGAHTHKRAQYGDSSPRCASSETQASTRMKWLKDFVGIRTPTFSG